MGYEYEWPRPGVTVDSVVFARIDARVHVLLVRRRDEPYAGRLALPGGFVDPNENLERAARRELGEETGLRGVALRQLVAVGDDRRDPRGWSVAVAYWGLVDAARHRPCAGDDAAEADWMPLGAARGLAFDHGRLLAAAVRRLRWAVLHEPVLRAWLPETFTLAELRRVYESVLGRALEPRRFARQIDATGMCPRLGDGRRRRFDEGRCAELERRGFVLDLGVPPPRA